MTREQRERELLTMLSSEAQRQEIVRLYQDSTGITEEFPPRTWGEMVLTILDEEFGAAFEPAGSC